MKFSTIITLVTVAVGVNAAAIASPDAEANPDPWCTKHGQSCWKKREAEASPEAWCTKHGQSCWKVKRVAEAFANAITSSGGVVESREASFSNMPGNAAYNAKRAIDELAGVVAATRSEPETFYNDLNLFEEFSPDAEPEETEKRDVITPENDKRWCTKHGQSCWKAKRAAEAIVNTIDSFAKEARDVDFEPVARGKREAGPEPWCTKHGQSCWKREASSVEARCNELNGACSVAKRDLHAMYAAARSVLEEMA
ncbi:putative pheromone precursor protein 1 protein [Phaeoacremonium minimum UCRPA7]|uniref:Putative pheromone protein 1 protein n=1 Tax=Phaeoacremonium minimum (strain UCR-PA7) TaxID=1286976 RepID=R8BTB0_PHAM7|nr:putative pheromone precursor protein 1 protein [Phaeoacremonium minimum UCRPA7]EOO02638.1 putative pheromone precursor protein 1 protein [Phaeoacremonium minimum UCRPA7]